ncbi:MAG: hypothetical protein Q8M08_01490 [Bacteroidales bacterium]|nr:hypothetical protein [Bacteroidales bacterium]
MKPRKEFGLDFEIDKLTNSIENVVTGDSFATDISFVLQSDFKTVSRSKDGYSIGEMNTKNLHEMFTN